MEKSKIQEITSINNHGTSRIKVGLDGVATIKDNSIRKKKIIHIQFDAYDENGELLKSYMNGNFIINYFKN